MKEPAFYDFQKQLNFSRGQREKTDVATILRMIPGAVSCVKTNEEEDRKGIDYIVTLRRGAKVNVDAKARDWNPVRPAHKFWERGIPDLALEIWSVAKRGGEGKAGWTLSERSDVDLILFTYDERDTTEVFLVGFQHLRIAFRRNLPKWEQKGYRKAQQTSGPWVSECIFIPSDAVLDAISEVSRGWLVDPENPTLGKLICSKCGQEAHELLLGSICPDCWGYDDPLKAKE